MVGKWRADDHLGSWGMVVDGDGHFITPQYANSLEAEVARYRAALEEIAAHVEEKLGGGLVLSMTSAEITRWYEDWTAATPAATAHAALEGTD